MLLSKYYILKLFYYLEEIEIFILCVFGRMFLLYICDLDH